MSIVFQNPGVIDRKSITSFGVSSKENPGAIGFFGTGLKYAIAILLREGCSISIYAGGESYIFGKRRQKVRAHDFEFVTMNRRALDFTTEVGKTWEIWQAFRELYCNCVDEKGECYRGEAPPLAFEALKALNSTYVVVSGDAFERIWEQRHEIVLSSAPLYKGPEVWIHPGASQYLYYRGVRIHKLPRPTLYTYNVQVPVELTEDRTLKYHWYVNYYLGRALLQCEDRDIVAFAVLSDKDHYEAYLEFGGEAGEAFKSIVVPLAVGFDPRLNKSAATVCRKELNTRMRDQIKADMPELEHRRMERALGFLRRLGFNVEEYPISVSEFLGENVLGMAHDDTIFVSRRALMMGTKQLAGTLLEEYLHLKHKLDDTSREMQNFLLDTVMTLGERVTGEPL